MDSSLGERLRKLRKAQGINQQQMADILGVTRRSYGLYEQDKRTPTMARLEILAGEFPVSMEWLIRGEDGDDNEAPAGAMMADNAYLPVLTLAECGLKGWYQEQGSSTLKVGCPADMNTNGTFAVMATGTSLVPEGVKPGYVCLCAKDVEPQSGDVVFIREEENRCGLKVFRTKDVEWLHIEGYLPPDDVGEQMIYTERRKASLVKEIATVVYVKRKY